VCSRDPVHWINTWAWTYDPRETPSTRPFDLFPRQAEFIRWLQEREGAQEEGIAEKSRDVGFTWLCVAYAVHAWRFRKGVSVGFGSRKLELVDKIGDPDSIFEKIRLLLHNLPAWMLPAGFTWTEHDNFCKLINPENGSTVTGEGGDNIGRGGRKTLYFVDEAAFLERPQRVEAALSQTTRVKIWVSTPNGPGNPFATKRASGKFPVFTFRWQDDPRKGDAWYAEQKRILDPVVLAQEVDIDYTASVEGICIPALWVRAAVGLELPASGPVEAGLDVAEEGPSRSVLVVRQGPVVQAVEDWGQLNTTATAWKAADIAEAHGVETLHYDCGGVGAGIRGTYESALLENDAGTMHRRKLGFNPHAVNGGEHATESRWPDGKTSRERFLNLRTELWCRLARRFEKAYEFREQGIQHPPEEMISIPNHPQLIAELSMPLKEPTETGKVKLESKPDMRKRGIKSPDFADALAYAFAPGGLGGQVRAARRPARTANLRW
jgi:phage terminase large subunit